MKIHSPKDKYKYFFIWTKLQFSVLFKFNEWSQKKIQTIWMLNCNNLMREETMIVIAFGQGTNKANRASINFESTSVGRNRGRRCSDDILVVAEVEGAADDEALLSIDTFPSYCQQL